MKSAQRSGVTEALMRGNEWLEAFDSRKEANAFQRSLWSTSSRKKIKIKCKTYLSVDPETDLAVFIVGVKRVE